MNNKANNTSLEKGGKPYPELMIYWNFFHMDEIITTNWVFYTYLDNLSFLGGLLDISLFVPFFLMMAYTFRLNEINVFFYQQVMKKWIEGEDDKENLKTLNKNPHSKYSKYILNNYFTISFRIAFHMIADKLHLIDCCGTNLWQKLFSKCSKKNNNTVPRKKVFGKNSEHNEICTSSSDSSSDSDLDIGRFRTRMKQVNTKYFDLQSILSLANKIEFIGEVQKLLLAKSTSDGASESAIELSK